MIKKIIAGGQTGAERAALDVAIKLNIDHGGWIPEGRTPENGVLPEKYRLQEIVAIGDTSSAEQNILDSDGTLIISHGPLQEKPDYVRRMVLKHQRPWLHIDLKATSAFRAADNIHSWGASHEVRVLHVTGPEARLDPGVYQATVDILEAVFYLSFLEMNLHSPLYTPHPENEEAEAFAIPPRTIDEAVERLMSELSLKDRATIANKTLEELTSLRMSLGGYIKNNFGLLAGNQELMKACRIVSKDAKLQVEDATALIIRELWQELRETHRLRRVK